MGSRSGQFRTKGSLLKFGSLFQGLISASIASIAEWSWSDLMGDKSTIDKEAAILNEIGLRDDVSSRKNVPRFETDHTKIGATTRPR